MNLCFDLGGMSLKYCYIENNKITFKDSIKFKGFVNGEYVLNLMMKLIEDNLNKDIVNICISSPGVINSDTGEITGLSAIIDLHKINFKTSLFNKYKIPVFIDNDSNCAALAELKLGNAKEAKNSVVILIGTGIGGSLIIDKKIFKGSFLGSGEFGCILNNFQNEKYINWSYAASMNFLEKKYFSLTSNEISGKEIYEKYYKDLIAKDIITEQITNLAILMLNLSFIIDPELVIVGGAVSQNFLFIKLLDEKIDFLFSKSEMKRNMKLKKCLFFNDSNLLGANELSKLH